MIIERIAAVILWLVDLTAWLEIKKKKVEEEEK
jgi:hypothetical protein